MDFNGLLRRANLNSIQSFLIYGDESFEEASQKTYSERITDAQKQAADFFKARYSDIDEYDEIAGYFNDQAAVFEEVYFEIGLILGTKIAFQLYAKMEELR
jgi:hypothetical protein